VLRELSSLSPGGLVGRRRQEAGGRWVFDSSEVADLPFVVLDEADKAEGELRASSNRHRRVRRVAARSASRRLQRSARQRRNRSPDQRLTRSSLSTLHRVLDSRPARSPDRRAAGPVASPLRRSGCIGTTRVAG
jgi:hypothetical protein